MVKEFFLKYKIRIILALFVFGIIWGVWYDFKLQLAKRDKIIEQAKIELFEYLKTDSLAKVEYANRKDEIEGLFLIQKEETIKWKDQYFEILDTKQDTIKETGQIKVTFKKENKCMGVEGYTLTATDALPSYSKVNIYGLPISIKRDFLEIDGEIVQVITPENDCIEFKNNVFDVSPGLSETYKMRKNWFGWGIGCNAVILDEDKNFEFKQLGISMGVRFQNIYIILGSDFRTTRLEAIIWK